MLHIPACPVRRDTGLPHPWGQQPAPQHRNPSLPHPHGPWQAENIKLRNKNLRLSPQCQHPSAEAEVKACSLPLKPPAQLDHSSVRSQDGSSPSQGSWGGCGAVIAPPGPRSRQQDATSPPATSAQHSYTAGPAASLPAPASCCLQSDCQVSENRLVLFNAWKAPPFRHLFLKCLVLMAVMSLGITVKRLGEKSCLVFNRPTPEHV